MAGGECRVSMDTLKLFRKAASSILMDDSFSIETEGNTICLENSRRFIRLLTENANEPFVPERHLFLSEVKGKLDVLVKNAGNSAEKLWSRYHRFRISEWCVNGWKTYLSQMVLNQNPLFYQHVMQEVFETIIKENFKGINSFTCSDIIVPALTADEENAVCYVGGYVVRSIMEHLHSSKDQEMVLMKNLLDDSGGHFPAQEWTESISRGGLKKISNEAFQFFYSVEHCIRRYLHVQNISNMDENFRQTLANSIITDDDVQFYWRLTGTMDEDTGASCLKLIAQKWITIRGFSFANSIMEMYKQQAKKGTGKSKGLRTKLFT